jgi:glycosyltransferase involved in cell wall biosynthesis
MSQKKLVSVIIPTYKRAKNLTRAIDSVLNQTYKNVEIIVVDDNEPSSKYRLETKKIMEKYQNLNNVIYLTHEKNKGGSAARNTGFRFSKGEYIMFLDDDDEFLPIKIEAQVNCLDNLDESWGVCYTNYIRKNNGVTTYYSAEKREGYLLTEVLMRNLFVHAGCNLMIRRSVVKEVQGFDESFVRNQDIEFLARILMKYKIAHVDVLGLVKHFDDRQPISKSYEEITEYYLEKFNPIIRNLPEEDSKKVYKMIDLQSFRNYILSSGKRKKALKLVLSGNLSIILVIRYMFHLINRKIRKKVYGFKI